MQDIDFDFIPTLEELEKMTSEERAEIDRKVEAMYAKIEPVPLKPEFMEKLWRRIDIEEELSEAQKRISVLEEELRRERLGKIGRLLEDGHSRDCGKVKYPNSFIACTCELGRVTPIAIP